MLKILRKEGFASFVEIIVTAVIFTLSAVGILTTISMIKPQTTGSTEKLEAAYIGKSVMDELRSQVDAQTWDDPNGNLWVDKTFNREVEGLKGTYRVNYRLEDVPDLELRKLTMNIYYPD